MLTSEINTYGIGFSVGEEIKPYTNTFNDNHTEKFPKSISHHPVLKYFLVFPIIPNNILWKKNFIKTHKQQVIKTTS